MSRVWNSRSSSSERTLKVKLRSPQQRRSPTKYAIEDFEGDLTKISGGKRSTKRRGVSPSAAPPVVESSPERGRSRGRKKKGKKRESSSSSSLSSLSTVSRSRSRSRSSSSSSQEVFGKKSLKIEEYVPKKKKKHKKKSKSSRKSHAGGGYFGENFQYYHGLEDGVNREKQADKCRTSKKAIQFIEHTKNRSTTYLKRSGSLILAAKELEIQTHCHISLHIQPTWPRGKQYRYLSGSNVHSIRSAEYADRWVGPNMCQVCGEQRETSTWLICKHSSSRRKQGCSYKVHCNCIGIYYTSAIELNQVPFYCPKHGRNRRMAQEYLDIPLNTHIQSGRSPLGVNGRQMVERSESGSVLVRDSNAPLGSEVIHVIDSTTGLRSAVRVDSSTASGTEMLLHFHSSIVQSAEMTGDPNAPVVIELPNETTVVPVSQVAGDSNVIQTQVVSTEPEEKPQNVNIVKMEPDAVFGQKVVSQDEDKNDLIDYSALAGSHQVVSVEEVQAESYPEMEQVVTTEEVEVTGDVVSDNQIVVVEEVIGQDGTIIQGGEQVVVQEVEMDGEYIEVPESQMVVETRQGTHQQLSGRTVVYVSEAQVMDPSEGVVFQMADDSEEQIVYSQDQTMSVVQETVSSVTPTKLERVEFDPNQPQEVDASSLPPGTEIVHIVDSNTAMVLEVQSDANAES